MRASSRRTTTSPPVTLVSQIHDRLALILHLKDYDRWLGIDDLGGDPRLPHDLLHPYDTAAITKGVQSLIHPGSVPRLRFGQDDVRFEFRGVTCSCDLPALTASANLCHPPGKVSFTYWGRI